MANVVNQNQYALYSTHYIQDRFAYFYRGFPCEWKDLGVSDFHPQCGIKKLGAPIGLFWFCFFGFSTTESSLSLWSKNFTTHAQLCVIQVIPKFSYYFSQAIRIGFTHVENYSMSSSFECFRICEVIYLPVCAILVREDPLYRELRSKISEMTP